MSDYLSYEGLDYYTKKLQRNLLNDVDEKLDLISRNLAKMFLTFTYQDGSPAKNLTVTNLFDEDGTPIETDSNGNAVGFVTGTKVHTLSIKYVDAEWSKSYDIKIGNVYVYNETVTKYETRNITATGKYKFSKNVTSTKATIISAGGGGGSGIGYWYNDASNSNAITYLVCGGSGGNGGRIETINVDITPELEYAFEVGTGGAGGSGVSSAGNIEYSSSYNGKNGGRSVAFDINKSGGSGGSCNAIGWGGARATCLYDAASWTLTQAAGSNAIYNSYQEEINGVVYGAFGSCGGFQAYNNRGASMTQPGAASVVSGGTGGSVDYNATFTEPEQGTIGNGGGGGAIYYNGLSTVKNAKASAGAKGGNGAIMLEMTFIEQ